MHPIINRMSKIRYFKNNKHSLLGAQIFFLILFFSGSTAYCEEMTVIRAAIQTLRSPPLEQHCHHRIQAHECNKRAALPTPSP